MTYEQLLQRLSGHVVRGYSTRYDAIRNETWIQFNLAEPFDISKIEESMVVSSTPSEPIYIAVPGPPSGQVGRLLTQADFESRNRSSDMDVDYPDTLG